MDEMQLYEVRGLMKYGYYSYRSDFERTRMEMTTIINMFSAKGKHYSPHQVLPFEWDETASSDDSDSTTMSEEDYRRLQKKAEQYEKLMSNGK